MALCSIGALYCFERDHATKLHSIAVTLVMQVMYCQNYLPKRTEQQRLKPSYYVCCFLLGVKIGLSSEAIYGCITF
jgi:hypothetical protein